MGQVDALLPALDVLYNDAACGLVLTSSDGTIRRVNATFCRWTGFSAAELIDQRRIQDLLTVGGRIFHQTHWAPLLQIQGSIAEVKLDVVHSAGHAVPMMLNAIRYVDSSEVFHQLAVFVAEDRHKYERELVLARRQAEDLLLQERATQEALTLSQGRLRLALESARLYVWDVDPPTGERRYEPDVALLLGHAQARDIGERDYADRIDASDHAMENSAFAQALDSTRPTYACTYRLLGVDGVTRTVSSVGRAVFGSDGTLLRFVGVLQDISGAVRQRRAIEDRAVFAEQMMGIVSHDLRNPLSAIKMSVFLLERGALEPKHRASVERIAKSANRANRLIGDLLDFTSARIGWGLAVKKAAIDLHAVVGEALGELSTAFDGRRLTHSSVGPGACMADADRLVQMLGNLVANAVTYGDSHSEVRVTSTAGRDAISIAVHNRGEPIRTNSLDSLFDPMTRGTLLPSGGRSVGLGLYIVREIAHAHGGHVCVASTSEDGTTFTVSLPPQ